MLTGKLKIMVDSWQINEKVSGNISDNNDVMRDRRMSRKMSRNCVPKICKMSEINESKIRTPNSTLPPGWRWVRLGDLCAEIYRYPTYYNIEYINEGIPEVRGELIKRNGNLENDLTKYRYISKETSQRYPRTVLKEDDFVLSVRGSMGKIAIVPKELEGANITANLIRISPSRAIVHSPFFKYVFLSEYFQNTLNDLSPQTTIKTIKAPILKSIKLPLPSLHEQKRIAIRLQELIQEVERARSACEKQLEVAKALPAAYLREVFESEEAKKWVRKKLGEVCEYDSGIWGEEPDGSEDCYYVLRSNNIQNSKIVLNEIAVRKVPLTKAQSKKMQIGDILVTTSSGSRDLIGKCALFDIKDGKDYLFSNFTMRLKPKLSTIVPEFLFYYLISHIAKYFLTQIQATTSGLRNLDRKEYVMQNIPLPPFPVQQHIALELKEKMTEVEKLRTGIENQLEAINALPQSILRKAFRGRL